MGGSRHRTLRVLKVSTLLQFVLILRLLGSHAWAQERPASTPFIECETAIANAETAESLPLGLLGAIARIESGRFDPALSIIRPWPWTINAAGTGRAFATKNEALDAVLDLQARGVQSIDIGCLQVNLLHHRQAFTTLAQAFDPGANAAYAAHFLRTLFAERLDWPAAAAAYHSRTPDVGAPYRQLVLAVWEVTPPPLADWHIQRLAASMRTAPSVSEQHSFAPPPLAGNLVTQQQPARSDVAARLLALTSDCADATSGEISPWGTTARASACGPSPFATVSLLRRALAAEAPASR
jgi:hypothetical protein